MISCRHSTVTIMIMHVVDYLVQYIYDSTTSSSHRHKATYIDSRQIKYCTFARLWNMPTEVFIARDLFAREAVAEPEAWETRQRHSP